jgi:hypothetical protein
MQGGAVVGPDAAPGALSPPGRVSPFVIYFLLCMYACSQIREERG